MLLLKSSDTVRILRAKRLVPRSGGLWRRTVYPRQL